MFCACIKTMGVPMNIMSTRLPASRSSSVGPEGHFSLFHPKVKVKETITLNQTQPWCCYLTIPPFPLDKIRGVSGLLICHTHKKRSKSALKVISSLFSKCCFFTTPPHSSCQRGGGVVLFDSSVNPVLPFEILNSQRVGIPSFHLWKVYWWVGWWWPVWL